MIPPVEKSLDVIQKHNLKRNLEITIIDKALRKIQKYILGIHGEARPEQSAKILKKVTIIYNILNKGKVLQVYQETLEEKNLSRKEIKIAVTLWFRHMLDCQRLFYDLNAQIDSNKDYIDQSLICESADYIELQLKKVTYIKSEFRKINKTSNEEEVSQYFEKIKNTPLMLSFITSFPKAETHAHLTGDIDPRIYIQWAIEKDLYFTIVDSKGVAVPDLELAKKENYYFKFSQEKTGFSAKLIKGEVFEAFCKKCSVGHIIGYCGDRFFKTFINFESIDNYLFLSEYLGYLSEKAKKEGIFYREVSKGFENNINSEFSVEQRTDYSRDFPTHEDFETENYKEKLNPKLTFLCEILKNKVEKCFQYIDEPDQSLFSLDNSAHIRLNVDVSRELPLPEFFADLLLAFLFVKEEMGKNPLNPRVVGIVISGKEDKPQCLADLEAQLKMIAFLKEKLFQAKLSPHAGELSEKVTGSLSFHDAISSVIEHAKPTRMGHCTSIMNTTLEKVAKIFWELKQQHICIEICPTSNEKILGIVDSTDHPVSLLLQCKIPITINTDDAGVNGITLAEELKRTLQRCPHIDYITFKALMRNQLRYCFMPDDGIWEDSEPYQFNLRPCFKDLHYPGKEAKDILSKSPKATLQRAFELRILAFEEDLINFWRIL